jgi:excinuclease ABC subunit C
MTLRANKFDRKGFSRLPSNEGLFCFYDSEQTALFVGAAQNLKDEVSRNLKSKNQFSGQIHSVEIWETQENLPRELVRLIRHKHPRFNFLINEQTLYPHLKITSEKFPRLIVTRRILNERDEYFGAFLPVTGVRIWLYVLNKIFRLRSCELDIRGADFVEPCQMFREKRCLAPCSENTVDEEEYAETVNLLRLFLSKNESELEKILLAEIESLAENLDFERAARRRDLLAAVKSIFANRRMHLWLDDAIDTFYLEKDAEKILVHIVTTRGRRNLGFQTYVFPKNIPEAFALSQVLWQFYQFHAPREIRLTRDFEGRKFFAECLSRQAKRNIKVSIVSGRTTQTAFLALKRSKLDMELKRLSNLKTTEEIQKDLQEIFSLSEKPKRIEAFDVAHISNQDFVAACAVWENGQLSVDKSRFWLLDSARSEPEAMAQAVRERLNESKPDFILLDGGQSQLKAVKEILQGAKLKIIAAVKPSGRHNDISYFLTGEDERIDFQKHQAAFEVLRALRDEAHLLANTIHRQRRETAALSNQAGKEETPLLVPIRFDESGGGAKNFRPISSFQLKF